MPAPTGNRFWELRSEHGRDLIFSNPDILWQEACKYFTWCDENPIMSYEWNGKDPVKCELEKARAYTLKGLCIFLDVNEKYFNGAISTNEDFANVCTRIRDIIFTQKFELAAAGLLNPNIIARDLGLVDKQETAIPSGIEILVKGQKFADENQD